MAQTQPLEWRPEYALGIASVDKQHRVLLSLLNEVRAVDALHVAQQTERDKCLRLLAQLNDYAAYHFLGEEALMREHLRADTDADVAAHIAAHRAYWVSIAAFRQRYLDGSEPAWSELVGYLENWWLHHIQETDRALAGRLALAGVR